MGEPIHTKGVYLEWWDGGDNLGDSLSQVVYSWMLERKHISPEAQSKNAHLMTIGSLIGSNYFDATVWGSGIMCARDIVSLSRLAKYVKYDIRAVRGPITREFLIEAGYKCPEVYGDPAVLMPLIYHPTNIEKKYKTSVILHHLSSQEIPSDFHPINIKTTDYKSFISEVLSSELIISSSLHGIILAESYGIPCLFFNMDVLDQSIKYLDWYYSTGRYNVKMITDLNEITDPMSLPDLHNMQNTLIDVFPYDLWESV